jgi:hypothetical protein
MSSDMTPDLWHELERIESAWYEVGTQQLSFAHHDRIDKLKMLCKMGYVRWWEHVDGRHSFFGITEQGCEALKSYRLEADTRKGKSMLWPHASQ